MDTEKVLAQADALLAKGGAVPLLPAEKQPAYGGARWVEARPFREWRAQSIAFLLATLPDNHTYVQEFVTVTESPLSEPPDHDSVESGQGVLAAAPTVTTTLQRPLPVRWSRRCSAER